MKAPHCRRLRYPIRKSLSQRHAVIRYSPLHTRVVNAVLNSFGRGATIRQVRIHYAFTRLEGIRMLGEKGRLLVGRILEDRRFCGLPETMPFDDAMATIWPKVAQA